MIWPSVSGSAKTGSLTNTSWTLRNWNWHSNVRFHTSWRTRTFPSKICCSVNSFDQSLDDLKTYGRNNLYYALILQSMEFNAIINIFWTNLIPARSSTVYHQEKLISFLREPNVSIWWSIFNKFHDTSSIICAYISVHARQNYNFEIRRLCIVWQMNIRMMLHIFSFGNITHSLNEYQLSNFYRIHLHEWHLSPIDFSSDIIELGRQISIWNSNFICLNYHFALYFIYQPIY